MARPKVLIPHLFRLADAINFRKDYSPPSSPPSRPFTNPKPCLPCLSCCWESSGKAPEAKVEGTTVVVGVREPADAESRALLTWVLVNVAAPLDRVIAVHVVPASAAEAAAAVDLEAMLGVYEGFCNLKQVAALYSESLFRLGSLLP